MKASDRSFKVIFNEERQNLKPMNDYSDIPHKLAKKITDLIFPNQQVHQSKIEPITPFHLASITGNFTACKLIIDSVDDKNSYNFMTNLVVSLLFILLLREVITKSVY